eukprot:3548943-Pyramimonas_sp.AAC.1
MAVLSASDMVSLGLGHLSAFAYESGTHDQIGAARPRAAVALGSGVDIAPGWLIAGATPHGKMERQ